MNSKGGMKSTGLFISAEIGYSYRFDFTRKKGEGYTEAVADGPDGVAVTKSNTRRAVR